LNNSILPSTETPENGTAQIWRAILQIQKNGNSTNQDVWVFRRIGSGISKQLELVSNLHLRQALSLSDGMQVIVKLQYD
jgi:CTP-dependent riboflavin kinase